MTNQPFEFMNVSYPPVCCQGEDKGFVIEFSNFAECFCLQPNLQLTALYFTRTSKKCKKIGTLSLCYKNRSDFATSLRKLVLLVSVA